jgi:ADP-dependent NAD(P)H-hydrate dehydratase
MTARARSIVEVDAALLRRWPIRAPAARADKEERGTVLVIAGSRELAGAALLAAEAALRAGAGKLVVATGASVAPGLALALPEARIVGLAETRAGGFAASGLDRIVPLLEAADAVLVGPGLADERATLALVRAVVARPFTAPLVLDALAIGAVADLGRMDRPVLVTPHAGEMAHLTGEDKERILADPERHARALAQTANLVVALKGAATHVATAEGRCWRHRRAVPGLATSGSGDVLAGIVAGLIARGAEPAQAAVWAVALHARAGEALARRTGRLGYLARELAAEVPALLERLQGGTRR